MTKSTGLLAALLFLAFVVAGVVANPALAQEKTMDKSVQKAAAGQVKSKEIDKNDKLRILDLTFMPLCLEMWHRAQSGRCASYTS